MRTIAFISKIKNSTLYFKFDSSIGDVPYKSSDVSSFVENEILLIDIDDEDLKVLNEDDPKRKSYIVKYGVVPRITKVIKVEVFDYKSFELYTYKQLPLYYIGNNDFRTTKFCNEILCTGVYPISDILKNNYLRDILTYNPNLDKMLTDYVDKINIEKLVNEREITINEYKDSKGKVHFTAKSTFYPDNYLNKRLFIAHSSENGGFSYCSTCVYDSYGKDYFMKRLNEDIERSRIIAINGYSRSEHLTFLKNQCDRIRRKYLEERRNTFSDAYRYLQYTLE